MTQEERLRAVRYVYIAGPYSDGDVAANVRRAMEVGDRLLSKGFIPYVPHLTHFMHLHRERAYDDWVRYGVAMVERNDAVLRLEGLSNGADREVARALQLDLPVFMGESEFVMTFPQGALVR